MGDGGWYVRSTSPIVELLPRCTENGVHYDLIILASFWDILRMDYRFGERLDPGSEEDYYRSRSRSIGRMT
jgi:hypothetical protein